MTWNEIAARIAQMTPEERQKEPMFREPYDQFKLVPCTLHMALEDIEDEDGEIIKKGEWYLC